MEVARFYQQIVGGSITESGDDWVELEIEGASNIAFQLAPDHVAPIWPSGGPQQAHLDLDVPDLDVGEAAVLALGAVKTELQPEPNSWRVFLDPAGHPFCLVKESSS